MGIGGREKAGWTLYFANAPSSYYSTLTSMGRPIFHHWTSPENTEGIWHWGAVLLVCAAVGVAMAGCATEAWYRNLSRMEVTVVPSSNRGVAVAVDLVGVYERALADSLRSTTARQWFGGKREWLRRQYPDGFQRWSWEWASGQAVAPKVLSVPARTNGLFVFASYQGRKPYRVEVKPLRDIELFMGETSFQARPARE